MNKCQKCGAYVPMEQDFCQNCGAPMTPEAERLKHGPAAAKNLAETIAAPSAPQTMPQPPGATTGAPHAPPGHTSNPNDYNSMPPPQTSFPPPALNYNVPAAAPAKSRTGLYIGLGVGALVLGGVLLFTMLGALVYFASDSENTNVAASNRNTSSPPAANNNNSRANSNSSLYTGGQNAEDPESANDRPITDRK